MFKGRRLYKDVNIVGGGIIGGFFGGFLLYWVIGYILLVLLDVVKFFLEVVF